MMSLPGRGCPRAGYGLAEPEPLAQGHVGARGGGPSRTVPGLWHLTLFRWNEGGAPRVTRAHG